MEAPVFLSPGGIHVSAQPATISTVLGSCVAVCLWDSRLVIGGMNHFLLPRSDGPPHSRFGDVAIARLLQRMAALGCRAEDLSAKVFGGAAVLPIGPHAITVGEQNVASALAELGRLRVPVVAGRTGGVRGLVLRFYTGTGRAMVRELAVDVALRSIAQPERPVRKLFEPMVVPGGAAGAH
jgi:chemotaxis protein CheD